MDIGPFASVFALVFVAELPGKTTFASLLMAARAKPWPVFLGACGAFAVHGLIAVAAGSLVGLLPARAVRIVVGLVFLALAALIWRQEEDALATRGIGRETPFAKTLAAAFGVIFAAQWGDPSQLATAAMAAKYEAPGPVFLSATAALWAVTGLAVIVGHWTGKAVHPRALQKIAALVFAAVGLAMLTQAFREP